MSAKSQLTENSQIAENNQKSNCINDCVDVYLETTNAYLNTTNCLIIEEIPYIENTIKAFNYFLNDTMPFLLESALHMERYGRYTLMGSNPKIIVKSKAGKTEIEDQKSKSIYYGNPFSVISETIKKFGQLNTNSIILSNLNSSHLENIVQELPFAGGAVGYFGYDLNRQIEKMPDMALDDQGIPDIILGFYDRAVIIDHKEKKSYIVHYLPDNSNQSIKDAKNQIKNLINRLNTQSLQINKTVDTHSVFPKTLSKNLQSNFTKDEYMHAIQKAKNYIFEGDIFQVNLAQRFTFDLKSDHFTLYKKLREKNPAPFAAFLKYNRFSILSSSPERFMYVNDRYVETRPIKGTRPRFEDLEKDEQSKKELANSEKDSAENVMIVDVKRNDLGRVCEIGSIHVPELMVIESYKAVHHLVSTVVGTLKPDVGFMDLLMASFPGGSITGAPKIRAMEIIEELEPHRRNAYCGAIGYISTNKKMDTNIVIRTITAIEGKGYLQVGGGIVADSDPLAEYEETLHKAHALFKALGR